MPPDGVIRQLLDEGNSFLNGKSLERFTNLFQECNNVGL
jgi:hypothetical protein